MNRFIIFLIAILSPILIYSQSMTMTGNSNILMQDGAKIIFLNATPNNIQKIGTLGGIRTLGENAQVIFKNVNQVGAYMVPFVSSQGNTIPFTYNITTLGSNPGEIRFSSWETDDSNSPIPTGVTHITDMSGIDNSSKVIDRFWKVEVLNYAIKPKGGYEFTYDDNDLVGNFINESGLAAQRWNSDDLLWGDWLYSPTANTLTNKVNILVENIEDQYSIWTLVDQADPLPIELVRFVTNCRTGNIEWTTFSETNSSHFGLEYSDDGYNWKLYEIVEASSNSNSVINYSIKNPNYKYYRIKMVDKDDSFEYSDIIINNCIEYPEFNISVYPNPVIDYIYIDIDLKSNYNLIIYDASSKVVFNKQIIEDSKIDMIDFSSGLYMMLISDGQISKIHKITKI